LLIVLNVRRSYSFGKFGWLLITNPGGATRFDDKLLLKVSVENNFDMGKKYLARAGVK
jgi:hypothetical protein